MSVYKSFFIMRSQRNCGLLLLFGCWLISIGVTLAGHSSNYDENSGTTDAYDFIIVGGGTAGCALAGRLSENANYTILVLEAGDLPHPGLEIPALVPKYHKETNSFKVYSSVPQKTAGLKDGGMISYLTGQVLGGSSVVNGMAFNRGSPHDYNNWARITNDSSWSYERLLSYFKKVEDYRGEFPSESEHGREGPVTVSQPSYAPGLKEWLQAGKQLGYSTADPNGPQKISFTPVESSKKFGRRVNAYKAYIEPVFRHRPHLKIITNSKVSRVTFKGNRATGVVYRSAFEGKNNITENYVTAKREIIVSAGVIGSPALLMKSGIGPKDVLSLAGISPVKYLPVGHNFQDHAVVSLNFLMNNRSEMFIPERDLNQKNWENYNRDGDGPYSAYMNQLQAFLASSVATRPSSPNSTNEWPDTHFLFCQSTLPAAGVKREEVGAKPGEYIVANWVLLGRPKSTGRVILNSSDPINGDPLIDFNFYSHPEDNTVILEGIETALKLFEQTVPYKQVGVRYPVVPIDACKHAPFRSREYWLCYMRQGTTTGLHGGGTCRMGKGEQDPDAVVDSKLRVIGIENLRIVDTSVMPNVTNANTMVGAYVIAEKAADMILTEHVSTIKN